MDKRRVSAGFSLLAGSYDVLARLVFGGAIKHAHRVYIPQQFCKRALILGGGRGAALHALAESGLVSEIWYVDISAAMVRRAQSSYLRCFSAEPCRVHFVIGTLESVPQSLEFDLVCTHFFLDVFSPAAMRATVDAIDSRLAPHGLWLYADFRYSDGFPAALFSRTVISILYCFFRLICGVEARHLPGAPQYLVQRSLRVEAYRRSALGLIETIAYRKIL